MLRTCPNVLAKTVYCSSADTCPALGIDRATVDGNEPSVKSLISELETALQRISCLAVSRTRETLQCRSCSEDCLTVPTK